MGVKYIFSLQNWYLYANIWILIVFSISYIISLFFLNKLDIRSKENFHKSEIKQGEL